MTNRPSKESNHVLVLAVELADQLLYEPADFLAAFPTAFLMESLSAEPKVRARILSACVNMPPIAAAKIGPNTAAEILDAAIESGETSADAILEVFGPSDRVRYLPSAALFRHIVDDRWWSLKFSDPTDIDQRHFLHKTLEAAMNEGLLTSDKLRDRMGVDCFADNLVEAEKDDLLIDIAREAMKKGADGAAFTGDDLLAIVGIEVIVSCMSPSHLRDDVLLPLARDCGWIPMPTVPPGTIADEEDGSGASLPPEAIDGGWQNT